MSGYYSDPLRSGEVEDRLAPTKQCGEVVLTCTGLSQPSALTNQCNKRDTWDKVTFGYERKKEQLAIKELMTLC